ncbi:MAG: Hsp20/alpha crystallin family protein [Candidatus Cyclobacteriaceae bacterium M3_2C_046]
MSIVKRNPDWYNNFPNLFDDFFGRELSNWGNSNYSSTSTTLPAVNIRELNDSFLVEMAAPGMSKKDFKIELDNNMLTISSEKHFEDEQKDQNYTRKEFSYQSFNRTFTLPKEVVDVDKIKAKYENGVLHLNIPKLEEAKQKAPRKIEVV